MNPLTRAEVAKDATWNQSGYLYNSWHSVTVEVTA